jgi:hypothetical protein
MSMEPIGLDDMDGMDHRARAIEQERVIWNMQTIVGGWLQSIEDMTTDLDTSRLQSKQLLITDLETLMKACSIAASRLEQATQSQENKPFGNRAAQEVCEEIEGLFNEYTRLIPIAMKITMDVIVCDSESE